MLARLRAAGAPSPEGFLVQRRLRGGVEMILGFHRDPQLGTVLPLGVCGVATELFQDSSLRLLPITRASTQAMLEEVKATRLLRGWCGTPVADVPALLDAVMAFASLATAAGERLVEAEINPHLVLPEGQGVRAADRLAVLG